MYINDLEFFQNSKNLILGYFGFLGDLFTQHGFFKKESRYITFFNL